MKVHARRETPRALCNPGRQWVSCNITTNRNDAAVTCDTCRRLLDLMART